MFPFTIDVNEVILLFNNPKSFADVSNLQLTKSSFDINQQIDVNQHQKYRS